MNNIIATRIRHLRTTRHLSQVQLSMALHISNTTLSGYELGKSVPNVDMLCVIADYFDVTLDYLVGRGDADNTTTVDDHTETVIHSIKTPMCKPSLDQRGYEFFEKMVELYAEYHPEHVSSTTD